MEKNTAPLNKMSRRGLEKLVTFLRKEVARKEAEADALKKKMAEMAEYDPQTGLNSGYGFGILAKHILAEANRPAFREPHVVGVVSIDLDGLGAVNNSFGHLVGDGYIATAGRVIKSIMRHEDVAAHIHGDEYVILVHSPQEDFNPLALLQRLYRAAEQECSAYLARQLPLTHSASGGPIAGSFSMGMAWIILLEARDIPPVYEWRAAPFIPSLHAPDNPEANANWERRIVCLSPSDQEGMDRFDEDIGPISKVGFENPVLLMLWAQADRQERIAKEERKQSEDAQLPAGNRT